MNISLKRWTTSNKAVYNVSYHLIWCPKYRRKVLVGDIELRLRELLIGKSEEIGVQIDTMEIMPDHVHLFVRCSPTDSPHWVVQQLKGYSSRILRSEFSLLKSKLPTLWTRSYYCESIGHISERTIKKYIEEQKNH
jgi:putative transposase